MMTLSCGALCRLFHWFELDVVSMLVGFKNIHTGKYEVRAYDIDFRSMAQLDNYEIILDDASEPVMQAHLSNAEEFLEGVTRNGADKVYEIDTPGYPKACREAGANRWPVFSKGTNGVFAEIHRLVTGAEAKPIALRKKNENARHDPSGGSLHVSADPAGTKAVHKASYESEFDGIAVCVNNDGYEHALAIDVEYFFNKTKDDGVISVFLDRGSAAISQSRFRIVETFS